MFRDKWRNTRIVTTAGAPNLFLCRTRSIPTPKAVDQAAYRAPGKSQRTCDEKPEQWSLIGLRRQHHRPEETATKSDCADDCRPRHCRSEHASRLGAHSAPDQPRQPGGCQKRGACRGPRQVFRDYLGKQQPVRKKKTAAKTRMETKHFPIAATGASRGAGCVALRCDTSMRLNRRPRPRPAGGHNDTARELSKSKLRRVRL